MSGEITVPQPTCRNALLAVLPDEERQCFVSLCKLVDMRFMQVLVEPGDRISQVCFPIDGYISMVAPVDNNANIEVALVGNEGMLGISLILGVEVAAQRALVQGPGAALCMDATLFVREYEQSQAMQNILKRYLYVLMGQLAQTAACTRFHVVEERLARWLLMTRDRAHTDEFHITHELLAYILGVRRVGVTMAASSLQQRNLISYRRGKIKIIDHPGLENASCSCYAADREAYEKMMNKDVN
jgi:CRP-like cAMP-binding protein